MNRLSTIEHYASGKILKKIKLSSIFIRFLGIPIIRIPIQKILLEGICPFEPQILSPDEARNIILSAGFCASGERICRAVWKNTECTESIFLDDLGRAMIRAGKAREVGADEAIRIIEKYPDNPLVLSKVSGKYLEICRTTPDHCLIWRMEKCGIRCFLR